MKVRVLSVERLLPVALLTVLLAPTAVVAQQITGSISGSIVDTQEAAIANAKVTLTNAEQGVTRTFTTGADGAFVFTPLQPATYLITVEVAGFRKFEQKDIKVFANDRIALGNLIMQVGQLSETVTVEANVAQVQAQSAERSGVITGKQVVDLALTSRNFLDLAKTVPGVYYTGGLGGIYANGARGNQNNLTVDGITNVDTGSNGGALATTNIDMIAEFKVLTNSQQAEFGRSSGAAINIVTKSGSRDFHGTGYIFHRHEGLNANTWRNNIDGRQRQLYRYNFAGYNINGPVYIPGKFNRNRDKLFFVIGQEWQNQLQPNDLKNVTVPTALERQGDFSQTRDGGGVPVVIRDPLTNSPFPGNIIPKNRLNADGVKILSFYPLPNAAGKDPSFNYQTQIPNKFPRREDIYRGDWNISDKWRMYSRLIWNKSTQDLAYGQWNADYNIPFAPMNFGTPGWSYVTNVTAVLNPTLTNEFIFGSSKNTLNIDPVDNTFSRSKLGLSYQMPYPNADKLGLVQNWRFEGVPNGPFTGFNGTPFRNFNHTYDITDNVAKVMGRHTFKAGLYLQLSQKDQTAFTSINGNVYFNRDPNNPGDANWDFANAALGNFQRLQQSNQALNGQYRYWNVEWFVQDNWRVSNKLTLDYGIRFYWIQPQYDKALQTSSFNPSLYNGSNQGVLMQPGLNASGQKISINPITGEQGPFALVGSLVNTGKGYVNGLYANGMGRRADGYPIGLIDNRGIHYAPRLGLAYRFMDKTVLRAGAGIFYDRFQGNPVFDMLPNPPSTASPTFYYGNLSAIPPASAGVFFPQTVVGFDKNGQVPTTYNWNISIQREIPGAMLLDVGYVGSRSNHLIARRNYNTVPLGSAWLPQNQDPTNPNPKFDGTTTKQTNLYRPYPGYNDVNIIAFGAFSYYNSLQVSLNRRVGRSLNFGIAYTWSRTLGMATDDGTFNNPFFGRQADFGPLPYDIPHLFVANYVYNLPNFGKSGNFLDKPIARLVVNGWQVSGLTTIASGQPDTISFTNSAVTNLNTYYTGSANLAPRVVITKNPIKGSGDIYQWIDTSGFALPSKGSVGLESPIRPIRRPGDHNWDISVFKNIAMGSESRFLQLRLEMFNAWNHARFNEFNRTVNFNAAGQITNLPSSQGGGGGRFGFGAVTGTRDPRILQLAAKFYF